jgi:hypothetical protein
MKIRESLHKLSLNRTESERLPVNAKHEWLNIYLLHFHNSINLNTGETPSCIQDYGATVFQARLSPATWEMAEVGEETTRTDIPGSEKPEVLYAERKAYSELFEDQQRQQYWE